MQKIYRVKQLTGSDGLLGVSRATLWAWVKSGNFPQPIKLSERLIGWPSDRIEQWIGGR